LMGKNPHLIDFGSSAIRDAHIDSVRGKPDYLSPEMRAYWMTAEPRQQIRKSVTIQATTKMDIFSLGVVMHIILAGLPAIPHESADSFSGTDIERALAGTTTVAENLLSWRQDANGEETRHAAAMKALAELVGEMLSSDPSRRPEAFDLLRSLQENTAVQDALKQDA